MDIIKYDKIEKEKIIREAMLSIHSNELAVEKLQMAVSLLQRNNRNIQHVLLSLRD